MRVRKKTRLETIAKAMRLVRNASFGEGPGKNPSALVHGVEFERHMEAARRSLREAAKLCLEPDFLDLKGEPPARSRRPVQRVRPERGSSKVRRSKR